MRRMGHKTIAYLNGRFVREARACIRASDSGFLYGDGVYETLTAAGGRPRHAAGHLRRLAANLRALSLAPPVPLRSLPAILSRLMTLNGLESAVIRITLTRGPVLTGAPDFSWGRPTLFISVREFHGYPESFYERGVPVTTVPWRRGTAASVKSTSFQEHLLARLAARRTGAFESLLVDDRGCVLEGSMSNVFLLTPRGLLTPPVTLGILPGITRQLVMRAAGRLGLPVRERAFTVADMARGRGAFLTSSTAGCLPIRTVNTRPLRLPPPEIIARLRARS